MQIFLWKSHAEAITSKATQRLYFLKQLRRAGVPQAQLLYFYTGVIRPVLEYAAPVWNHLLTETQIDQIEAIQRRALRIIYSYTNDMPYISALYCAVIPSLADRRVQLSRKLFKSILQPSSCLFTLLPNPRDPSITTRLRSANKFPRLPSRTRKYQTFISYALFLSINLHNYPNIYLSILFLFLQFSMIVSICLLLGLTIL